MEATILAAGAFKPQDIEVSVNPSNRKIDSYVEGQLDALWTAKETKAKEQGKRIYNGLSYRLNSLSDKDGKLHIDLGVFDFKTRECLLEAEGFSALPEPYWRKGCYSMATVRTSDNLFLLVELSGKSMNVNKTDFIGGIMETEPPIINGDDLFESFYRELEEEAFVACEDIADATLNLVYLNYKTNAGFYFDVNLNRTSMEVQEKFKAATKELDIRGLLILTEEEYKSALLNHESPDKQFLAKRLFQ